MAHQSSLLVGCLENNDGAFHPEFTVQFFNRTAAEKLFTTDDLAHQNEVIICRKDKGVNNEISAIYKDIDTVIANQTDLVKVVHTLKQVLCIKG